MGVACLSGFPGLQMHIKALNCRPRFIKLGRDSYQETQLTFTRNYVDAFKIKADHFFNSEQKEPCKQVGSLQK